MLHVPCSKFSQLFNSEILKIFQQMTKLPSAMQCLHFLDHPVSQSGGTAHKTKIRDFGTHEEQYAQYLY